MIEIDEDVTVIVEISGGCVSDSYVPHGLHLVVVDRDNIEVGEEIDEITEAAIKILDDNR